MAIPEILKSTPLLLWGTGSVGAVGLFSGGGYLHEETNASWDVSLNRQDYQLNPPESYKLVDVLSGNQSLPETYEYKSEGCFSNFFSQEIDVVTLPTEVQKMNVIENGDEITEQNIIGTHVDNPIGCSSVHFFHKDRNFAVETQNKNGNDQVTKWRVVPEQMLYRSEITVKNGQFGMSLWTFWSEKMTFDEKNKTITRQDYKFEHILSLLKKENEEWVVKGKYLIPVEKTTKDDSQNIPQIKIGINESVWVDTTKTYDQDSSYVGGVAGDGKTEKYFGFGEGDRNKSVGSEVFDDLSIKGNAIKTDFKVIVKKTDKTTEEIEYDEFKKQVLDIGYKPFKDRKGTWKNLDFCESLPVGKSASDKDADRFKNFCYKKKINR